LIEGDAAPIHCADEDHAVPHRDAATIGREQHLLREGIELRLKAPEFLPGLSVQRCHPIPSRD
jgi:hypothetical protein